MPRSSLRLAASCSLLLGCLLWQGCPAGPQPPAPAFLPPSAQRTTAVAATAQAAPAAPAPSGARPNALQASEQISRSEVLEAQPREVLDEVFARGRRGLLPRGWSVAVCTEQLRSADVPPEALDLVLVAIQRALDAQPQTREARARLRPALRTRLARDLRLQSQGLPGLAAWTEALLGALDQRRDLACARDFLERVHVLWRLARKR